jgi:ribose/xylose/arabinose/galactoside ABC-type transport system permease subunit
MTALTSQPSTSIVGANGSAAAAFARRLRALIFSQEFILMAVLIGLSLFFTAVNPRFARERNISDILLNSSYIAVAAVGMSMVIISGNIDISVGSMIGVLATLSGTLSTQGVPVILCWLAPLVVGPMIGAVTGFLVAYMRIPAIVVTLGMMSILQGGLIIATGGVWIYDMPPEFKLAQQSLLGVPVPVYFMIILTIVAALWMRYTPAGREIYAVGGNKEAARLSGISERRVIMRVFMINGFCVGIASVLFATQFSSIQSTVPPGVELTIITSSVVGGVSILGGVGTVIGSTIATILLRAISSGMIFINLSAYWIQAVQGLLILLTVLADLLRRRRQSKFQGK